NRATLKFSGTDPRDAVSCVGPPTARYGNSRRVELDIADRKPPDREPKQWQATHSRHEPTEGPENDAQGQEAGAQGLDWPESAGTCLSEVLANAPLRMMRSQATDIRDRFAYRL